MIQLQLRPAVLPVGASITASLLIRNCYSFSCHNLVLEFAVPPSVSLESGRRRIELAILGPGEEYDHKIGLHALRLDPDRISIPNLSYRDGSGRSQRESGRSVPFGVTNELPSGPVAIEPVDLPQDRVRPTESVFISYRRRDARWIAGRLAERLRRHFSRGQVFFDERAIALGEDFRSRLDHELASCAALIALIGPGWLSAEHAGQRRLSLEDDYVRHEIGVALRRNILVIPVLFDTGMPAAVDLPADIQALTYRQAQKLDPNTFNEDVIEIALALRAAMMP